MATMESTERLELGEVARRFRDGSASGEQLSEAFGESTIYCVLADEPGFVAVGEPDGAGFVLMYSSEEALVAAEGPCRWFAGRGIELLQLVPEEFGVVLDRGADSEVCLAPWAIVREPAAADSAPGGPK